MQQPIAPRQALRPQRHQPMAPEEALRRDEVPARFTADDEMDVRLNEPAVTSQRWVIQDFQRPSVDWDWGPEAERRHR
jgi:hypothetical protein